MKTHQFVVTVKTDGSQKSALNAVLCSFASRQPDGCEFSVTSLSAHRRNQHRRILRACEENRRRVGAMTNEQREKLHSQALEIIAKGVRK